MLVFLFGTYTAWSAPKVTVKTEHYSVYGITAKDIRRYMTEKSPAESKGKKYDGYTRWHVRWRFNLERDGELCYLEDIQTEVKITIMMPKLELLQTLPVELQDDWKTYYDALTKHENGHRDYGIKAIHEIDDSLNDMDGRDTCENMKSAANKRAHKILDRYKERETRYDESTQHGLTQGAYFPRRR